MASNLGTLVENVTVLQAKDPGDISIWKASVTGGEQTEIDRLTNELATILGHSAGYAQFAPSEITLGKNYVARVAKKSNQWCRIKVEDIMTGASTYKVICHLIDYGQTETVDRYCLRQVDKKYFDLPAQVKSVALAEIVPAALITDENTLDTDIGQSKEWNPSAIQYLRTLVVGRLNVTVKYVTGSNHKVIMYRGQLCINDELVKKRMALRPVILAVQPQKIMSFEEFEERERLMEQQMLQPHSALQNQSGDWEPLLHALPKPFPSTSPRLSPTSQSMSNSSEKVIPKGRGKLLLESLERASVTPVSVKKETSSSNYSTPRLPKTQSAAENISPALQDSYSDSDTSGRGDGDLPLLSVHNHSSFPIQSDANSTSRCHGNTSDSALSDGSFPVYKRSRRPNLAKKKVETSVRLTDNSLIGAGTKPTLSTVQRLFNSTSHDIVSEGTSAPYTEPLYNGTSNSIISTHSTNSLSDRPSSKSGRVVSFSDTDEVKEFTKESPAEHLLKSRCESDERLYDTEPFRTYQKSLITSQELTPLTNGIHGAISAITYDQSRVRGLKKQVTVFSDVPITPVFSVTNSKLHEKALRHWRTLGGSDKKPPQVLQAYIWPALRRGWELVAVTDPFYMEGRDGVSLSYLMAIATLLFDVDSYKCLPRGSGPRCLILCASWSKAQQIYFHVSSLFGEKPGKSLLVLHGRRETEHRLYCQLINGTDVIVSTPYTFIRMLKDGHVNVERLCHLLIDDADIVTTEFPSELSAIMKEVGVAVMKNAERAAPRQIALFSTAWSKGLELFKKEYMTAPVTVITNKIEAAVACNVKQMIHYIEHEEQRLGTMLKLVEESGSPEIKLIVCTHTESDASKVYKALKAYSREVYVAMKSLQDIDQTIRLWEEVRSDHSYPILVLTDEVLDIFTAEDSAVVDAKYILHYNMPSTKKLLGLRLHCLSGNYAEDAEDLRLSSHIIFSAKDHQKATTLVKIFNKTGGEIPEQVRQLSINAIEKDEMHKRRELCPYLKSFGVCRDHLKCVSRHAVSARLDSPSPTLPTSGDIEFKVVSVKDAATFYARLLRHRDVNGVQHDVKSSKFSLDLSLQAFFSQPYVQIPIDPATVQEHKICVYGKDNMYYRAQIIYALPDPSAQFAPEARVFLLDEGRQLKVPTNQLFELPNESSLEAFPLEIAEIKICKLKPLDHDIDWSSEANAYMSHLLCGETLSGKIQLCLGNTLWCDPIVKRQYLKEFGLSVSLWYAGLRLFGDVTTGHLAAKNPQHIELLRKACEGKISLPAITNKPAQSAKSGEMLLNESAAAGELLAVPTRHLEEGEASHVYVSEIEDPNRLFVILTDQHQRLLDMEDELQEVMRKKGRRRLESISLRTLCVAQYPDEEKRWCRCVVISNTDSKLQLLSIDYGRLFEVKFADVSGLPSAPEDLTVLPYQAIECHLATVMPVSGAWTDEAGDLIWNHCGMSTSLFARVLTTKPSQFIGDTNYGVELIDVPDGEPDVYISHLLINNNLALERRLNIMEQLGMAADLDQFDYPFQQIPRLVRMLNRTESHERRLLIVQYIRQLVQQSINLKDEMRRQGILKTLCSLVNTVNLHDDLLAQIVDSFTILTSNSLENCEELWWEKGFTFLHEKLELCDDNGLLTRVLSCLKHMLKANCIKDEVDGLDSFTSNLVHIARTSTLPRNRIYSLDVLQTYLEESQSQLLMRVTSLLKVDIARVLTDLINVPNDELIESCCRLIETVILTKAKQPNTEPWTPTLTRLAAVLFKVKSDLTLQLCAKALHAMLKNLTGATEILKFTQLHAKLERLVNSGLTAQTREACINVLRRIKPDPPSALPDVRPKSTAGQRKKTKQEIYLKPISPTEIQSYTELKIPTVLWWECSKYLMIQVQVHDAQTLDPPPKLTYEAERLHFRCGQYHFKLGPLYDKIVSTKSGREIIASEIKYALYKGKAELWSNLMKSGHKKPSYVRSNMDQMVTSSDDESYIDYEKSPFLIKPKATLKYSVFDSVDGNKTILPKDLAPPVDEFLSSDEKEEEEEDERYDHEYRRQYDFFNI